MMPAAHPSHSLNLCEFLRETAVATGGKPKRARTRAKILAVTAEEMERVGYEGLTVSGIIEKASIARGTFYLYYANRTEVAQAVFRRYAVLLRYARPRMTRNQTEFESIYNYNSYYVAFYAANAKLLAGREALMRDVPEVAEHRDWVNARWSNIVLRNICKRTNSRTVNMEDPTSILLIRSATAMVDELLREIYVYKSPTLNKLVSGNEQLANLVTLVWYRTIYGVTPSELAPTLNETN
jgi:AcrR family transcriptional regulator